MSREVLQGSWGPLPNHYGEPVLGAMIKAGDKMVTLEESQPNAFPEMHSAPQNDVFIHGALPGVWRGQPRLYLDFYSEIVTESEADLTRMGMLRTKANVEGVVLSCSKTRWKEGRWSPLVDAIVPSVGWRESCRMRCFWIGYQRYNAQHQARNACQINSR